MPLAEIIADVQARVAKIEMTEARAAQVIAAANLGDSHRDTALDVAAHIIAVVLLDDKLEGEKTNGKPEQART